MSRRSRRRTEAVSVEMTPLIDMVFLLLVFFLVATTFHQKEHEMKIALPAVKTSGPLTEILRELVVNVDDAGRIFVGGRVVSAEDLRDIVGRAVKDNPEQKVTVRGDRAVAYASVVSVLDICKACGVATPVLDTVVQQ